jgi:hypothetical protein
LRLGVCVIVVATVGALYNAGRRSNGITALVVIIVVLWKLTEQKMVYFHVMDGIESFVRGAQQRAMLSHADSVSLMIRSILSGFYAAQPPATELLVVVGRWKRRFDHIR